MKSENLQEDELNEPAKDVAALRDIVAFKFGGTSLLGAERMLHAARIVQSANSTSSVVVIVSAMKGVTDRLLGIGSSLQNGRGSDACAAAEAVIATHLAVLRDLRLDEDDDQRVRREMQSLASDLLYD